MRQDNPDTLPGDAALSLEQIVKRFEGAWRRGEAPDIDAFLPGAGAPVDRRALLTALVQIDLERRLQSDASVRIEAYLARYPELAADGTVLLDLIATEYELRRSRGLGVTPEEYQQRFPRLSTDLSSRLKSGPPPAEPPLREVTCPYCKTAVAVGDTGQRQLTCPRCGSQFRLDVDETTAAWGGETLPPLGKFELLAKIGQGGFGTVYRARDTVLGRLVAVKVPRSERLCTAEDEQRFEREARAAAALEHPGIVRVLEFGRCPAFPFIVCEFVQGLTLADALTGRQFSFRETAQIGAQVADALEHAHQKKVVHRDVKPSNIMLAVEEPARPEAGPASPAGRPSGDAATWRPRLMDFGLARRQEDDVTVTLEGRVLGTLAYLSPEQARGEGHRADHRTDVYSLGVVLYEMLTGERPFRGSRNMLLHQVLCEEPRAPRKLNDRIPRDLETITLKCLAKEPDRRYRTAGEAAADLRHWLADEPIGARPVKAPERLWLWCRRRPAIALLSAALVLAFVGGFAGVSWQWLRAERHQREATRHFQSARRDVDTFLTGVSDTLRYYPGVQTARERLLQRAAAEYERLAHEQSENPELRVEFGRAFLRLGDVQATLNKLPQAEQAYGAAHALFDELARAHPRVLDYRLERANSQTKLGTVLHEMGRSEEAERAYGTAQADLSGLVAAAPHVAPYRDGLGTCLVNLSLLLHARGRPAEAEQAIEEAIQTFTALLATPGAEQPPGSNRGRPRFALASARNVRGLLLSARGRNAEAADVFREAVRDFASLGRADPEHPDYVQGRADSWINLANAQRTLGREDEGLEACEAATADYRDLLKAIPDVTVYREDVGRALTDSGQLLHKLGRNPEARQRLDEARAIGAALVEDYPALARYHQTLALTQISLAQVERDLGAAAEAEALLRAALETCARLAQNDSSAAYGELRAVCRSNLAGVLHQQGRHDEAQTEFGTAIQELRTLVEQHADVHGYRDELAWSYTHRGDLLLDMNQREAAAGDYRQALDLRRQLVQDAPDAEYRYQLAWLLANCRDAGQRDPAAAVELAEQARDLTPHSPRYWNAVGVAHYRAGHGKESLQALDEAQQRRPAGHGLDWFFLALAHGQQGDKQQAQRDYEQGVRWMDEHCPANPELKRYRDEMRRSLDPAAD